MASQLNITVQDGPPAMVAVAGELDIATGGLLRRAFREIIRAGRDTVVVDTSGLRFCDSTGLEILLEADSATKRAGGGLRLAGVHGTLDVILDATRLRHVFEIYESPAAALLTENALMEAAPPR
ncbi:STAS domain-containing protein [Planotetraspora sp. GP83]|uniref:STAS domain-containing protein n=1 Tax=Planotetraspora sp. GP83 TaxID=3156264 RepID=UPI0035121988